MVANIVSISGVQIDYFKVTDDFDSPLTCE